MAMIGIWMDGRIGRFWVEQVELIQWKTPTFVAADENLRPKLENLNLKPRSLRPCPKQTLMQVRLSVLLGCQPASHGNPKLWR
jgi:hypothetical protein